MVRLRRLRNNVFLDAGVPPIFVTSRSCFTHIALCDSLGLHVLSDSGPGQSLPRRSSCRHRALRGAAKSLLQMGEAETMLMPTHHRTN